MQKVNAINCTQNKEKPLTAVEHTSQVSSIFVLLGITMPVSSDGNRSSPACQMQSKNIRGVCFWVDESVLCRVRQLAFPSPQYTLTGCAWNLTWDLVNKGICFVPSQTIFLPYLEMPGTDLCTFCTQTTCSATEIQHQCKTDGVTFSLYNGARKARLSSNTTAHPDNQISQPLQLFFWKTKILEGNRSSLCRLFLCRKHAWRWEVFCTKILLAESPQLPAPGSQKLECQAHSSFRHKRNERIPAICSFLYL